MTNTLMLNWKSLINTTCYYTRLPKTNASYMSILYKHKFKSEAFNISLYFNFLPYFLPHQLLPYHNNIPVWLSTFINYVSQNRKIWHKLFNQKYTRFIKTSTQNLVIIKGSKSDKKNAMKCLEFLGKLSSNVSKESYGFKLLKCSAAVGKNGRIWNGFNEYEKKIEFKKVNIKCFRNIWIVISNKKRTITKSLFLQIALETITCYDKKNIQNY